MGLALTSLLLWTFTLGPSVTSAPQATPPRSHEASAIRQQGKSPPIGSLYPGTSASTQDVCVLNNEESGASHMTKLSPWPFGTAPHSSPHYNPNGRHVCDSDLGHSGYESLGPGKVGTLVNPGYQRQAISVKGKLRQSKLSKEKLR
ncbi:hypothetical protein EWB00_000124 [Schistosoma japonicum]|uniref:Uncharacterized protein n=1 Tax=Schistosoma japonicum TaxID=6182 RepID=A0A4Z2CKG8_SCHJA|nr:hypothetical protein EWB00_000124 [Schistosoma japonicum]